MRYFKEMNHVSLIFHKNTMLRGQKILSRPGVGSHCSLPSHLPCKNTINTFPYHYILREQTFAQHAQALRSKPALSSGPGAQ